MLRRPRRGGIIAMASLRRICILAGALALAAAAGCGDSGEPQAPPASAPTAQESPALQIDKPGKVEIPPPLSGNAPMMATELPADFPKDVPQHPSARVIQARASRDQGLAVSFVLGGEDDADAVASFYADSFAAQGWSTDIRRTPDGQAIFADKGDRTASALVRPGDEGVLVDLIIVQMPVPAGG
jgi:hypothetical protein